MKAIIFPNKVEGGTDYNYKLATYIKERIEECGGQANLARKSAEAPEVNPVIVQASENPDVFLRLSDGLVDGGRYLIACDAYSALVGSMNNSLNTFWGKPADSGLKVTETLEYSTTADIEIGFDSLASKTDEELQDLAKAIVEAGYWYPVKDLEVKDDANNPDPYFYCFTRKSTWHETDTTNEDLGGCSGKIEKDETDKEHPIHFLHIKTTGIAPTQNYTWTIDVDSECPATANKLVFMAKGTGKLYAKVGSKEHTEDAVAEWKQIEVTATGTVTSIDIGVQGVGDTSITGVWLTSDVSKYNKYPNGYRDELTPHKQETVPDKPMPALTTEVDFFKKAADKIAVPEPDPGAVQADSPTDGNSPSSPEGFGAAVDGILDQVTSNAEGVGGLVDLNSLIKIDTTSMLDQIKNKAGFDGKLSLSTAKDKLDGVLSGAKQQASQLISGEKDKLKGKLGAMSPAKMAGGIESKIPKKPKVPTPDVTKGSEALSKARDAKSDLLKKTTAATKADLKPPVDTSAAKATIAKSQEMTAKATSAIEQAKASKTAATNGLTAAAKGVVK